MNKRKTEAPAIYPRLMDIKALQSYLSLGSQSADRLAQEAGAKRRIGKRVVYDRELIDQHLDYTA